MATETHDVTFDRNRINGLYRARCTCCWVDVRANLTELKLSASVHIAGGEWEPIAAPEIEAA